MRRQEWRDPRGRPALTPIINGRPLRDEDIKEHLRRLYEMQQEALSATEAAAQNLEVLTHHMERIELALSRIMWAMIGGLGTLVLALLGVLATLLAG